MCESACVKSDQTTRRRICLCHPQRAHAASTMRCSAAERHAMLTAAMLTAAMFTAEMFTAAEGSDGSHHVLASPARSRCRCPRQLNGHPLPLCVHAFLRRTRRRTRELVSAGGARARARQSSGREMDLRAHNCEICAPADLSAACQRKGRCRARRRTQKYGNGTHTDRVPSDNVKTA